MPGCGKSTVGRHLARQLGLRFFDAEHEIEQRIGTPIREFFAAQGEGTSRGVEQAVIDELAGQPGRVLAIGGNAVLRPRNREALHARSHVVYLRATPEELARRLRNHPQRPLLQVGPNPTTRLTLVTGDASYGGVGDTLNFIVGDDKPGSTAQRLLPRLKPVAAGMAVTGTTPPFGLTVTVKGGNPVPSTTEPTRTLIGYNFTDATVNLGTVFGNLRSPNGPITTGIATVSRAATPSGCP